MPLLTRAAVGLGLSLLLGLGCFEEPTPGEQSGTETSANTGEETGDTGVATAISPSSSTSDTETSGGGCMGCLDSAGGCLPGTQDQACGVLAEACVICNEDSFCDGGQCAPRPPCTADNCDGCCDATGDCFRLDATTDQACGAMGQACAPCGDDFSCSNGTCISTACADECGGCCDGDVCNEDTDENACGMDGVSCRRCPTGTTCENTCRAIPGALWQVYVQSAMTAPLDEDDSSWDLFGGQPDPYVQAQAASRTEETTSVDNTTAPIWEQAVLIGLTTEDVSAGIIYTLFDDDVPDADDIMGACTSSLPTALFGVPVEVECSDENGKELWTLQLTIEAVPE